MRIRFVLRLDRTNRQGQCPIEYKVRIDSQQATRHSTGIFIPPDKWDSENQQVKGSSDNAKILNKKLTTIKFELNQVYDLHRAKGVFLSANELIDIYTGKKIAGCTLAQACSLRIEELQAKGRSKATISNHKRHYEFLLEFVNENLQISAIERRHVNGLWLKLRRKGYGNDYCNKIVANCKSLFIWAEKECLIDKNPFNGISFEWENEFDLTYLTEEELLLIRSIKWSDRLEKTVDNFLFMCYTGLHISDYKKLEVSDFVSIQGTEVIRIKRTKTKAEALIPFHPEAKKILSKYGSVDKLPRISGQKSNDYLKLIAEKSEIRKNLTNKVARKTFTNMCLNSYRMSMESVASMLGHKSTKYVKRYGMVRAERIIAEWKDRITA